MSVIEKGLLPFTRRAMYRYGSYTNEDRALPDYRDGCKPVFRRTIWALNNLPRGQWIKTARVSGDCFGEGTLVTLADGSQIPIEEVIVGDEVLTDTGVEVVTKTFVLDKRELYEVTTDQGLVAATPDQIFYVVSDGKEIEKTTLQLSAGDKVKGRKT